MFIKRAAFTLALAAFFLTAGCDSGGPETGSDGAFAKQLRQVTNEVPSFAGIDFEGDAEVEQLVVYLFEPEQRGAAKETLQNIFGDQAASIELRVRDTQGGASVGLVDKADGVVGLEGVIGISYGQHGYLYVGVEKAKGVKRAKEKLREIGISLDKVVFRAASMPVAY